MISLRAILFLFVLHAANTIFCQQNDFDIGISNEPSETETIQNELLTARIDSLVNRSAPVDTIIKAKITLSFFYLHKRRFKQEQKMLIEDLLSVIDKDKKTKAYAKILTYKGILQHSFGDFTQSINTHYQVIELKNKVKDTSTSWNYELIGNNLMAISNYEEAIVKLKISLALNPTKNHRPKTTQRLARAYSRINNYTLAEQYYIQSIDQAKSTNNDLMQGTSLTGLAEIYLLQEKHLESLRLLDQSLILRKNKMHVSHKIGTSLLLAKNYLALGQFKKAENSGLFAYNLSKKSEGYGYKQMSLRVVTDVYFAKQEYNKAEQYQKLLVTAIDSFYDLENRNNFLKLYTKLDVKEKENEIIKQQLIIDKEQLAKTKLKYIIGFFIALSLLLGYFFYKRMIYQRILKSKNKVISKSLEEKEILLKEIHHRVKNNLQMVSSLLGIQSRDIKDQKAKDAINEGRTRVHSMSLIHQDLYRKDNLTGVEMQNYLPRLAKDLINTYTLNKNENKINLKLDVIDIKLDVETVIPIGLIVNELLTNALKYAFPNNTSGEISISLKEVDNQLSLIVSDNGIGLNLTELNKKEESFGHSLIKAFRKKLDAEVVIDGNNGTSVSIIINKYKEIKA